MTETDINWESDVWTVIDNYFKTENNYMSSTQLDSYNTFLRQQIPKTIRQFNPITALYNPIDNDEGDFTGTHQFKIEFYYTTLSYHPKNTSQSTLPLRLSNHIKIISIRIHVILFSHLRLIITPCKAFFRYFGH